MCDKHFKDINPNIKTENTTTSGGASDLLQRGVMPAESEGMNIMPLYKEPCPKCESENVNSFIEYGGTKWTLVCKECCHRWGRA